MTGQRSTVLDVLRALAIFLVLGRHLEPCPETTSSVVHEITAIWARGGWVGVDLFFVLSGFLVSGLLFREHQIHGEIHFRRFFFRRGLKIYPAFAAFILLAGGCQFFFGKQLGVGRVLSEILFLQNYRPHVWFHTWSLAVEEHFYLLLPLLLILMVRRRERDPVPKLVLSFLVVAVGCLLLRTYMDRDIPYDFAIHSTPTHKRIDSLFAGVLISALFHYRHAEFLTFVQRWRIPMLLAGTALLTIPFIFPLEGTPWLHRSGYTGLYLGGGMVLASSVGGPELPGKFWRGIAGVGAHSYSIYLWHSSALIWAELIHGAQQNWFVYAGVYVVAAIGFGMFMSKLVEYPVLKLRDRYFPSRSKIAKSPFSEKGVSPVYREIIATTPASGSILQ